MTKRFAVVVAAGLAAAGCNSDKCPTETPQVSGISPSCTEVAGQPVSYPLRLCPTCNQAGATCDVDLSAVNTTQDIFLDPKVETCSSSNSCPPACDPNPLLCNFTAPTTPGDYTVTVFDPATNGTRVGRLTVIASGPESCAVVPATKAGN
jgi:hypothetical protein